MGGPAPFHATLRPPSRRDQTGSIKATGNQVPRAPFE